MTRSRISALILLSGLFWATVECFAQGEFDLALRVPQGFSEVLTLKVVQEISRDIPVGGNARQSIEMAQQYEVVEVDSGGNMKFRVTFKSIVFQQVSELGTVDYDSRKNTPAEEIPEVARGFNGLLDKGFTFQIDPRGQVLQVEGMTPVLKGIVDGSNPKDERDREALVRSLDDLFGDKAQKENIENMFSFLPQNTVKLGDTWERATQSERGFPMQIDHKWVLTSAEGGAFKIGVSSKLSSLPKAKPVGVGRLAMTYSISGTQSGTLVIDEKTGWITACKIEQQFSGEEKASGVAGAPDGMSWPVKVKSVISFNSALDK